MLLSCYILSYQQASNLASKLNYRLKLRLIQLSPLKTIFLIIGLKVDIFAYRFKTMNQTMRNQTIAIITGDIIGSRKSDATKWLKNLKLILNEKGKSPNNCEIFRGDMFQLEVKPHEALQTAIEIKASIKRNKNLDVRIAIGIGKQQFRTGRISESNGEAYTNSGICFEKLKKRRLAIKTPWEDFDKQWNLSLRLLSLTIDNWTSTSAKIITEAIKHSDLIQTELAKKLNRSQSTISESLNRAGYDEIKILQFYFIEQLNIKINQQ